MKKRFLIYLQLAVSLLLIAFFASSLGISQIFRPIEPFGWVYIGLIVFLVNLDRILMSYKWNILLNVKEISLPFSEVVRSYYIGTFWGTFLPVSVGGDAVRAYRISGQTNRTEDIVSSVIMERVLGMVATILMGMLAVGLFVTIMGTGNWKVAGGLIFLLLAFSGLVVLSFNTRLTQWFNQKFPFHKKGWMRKLAEVYRSYQAYQHHRGVVLRFLLWSLLEQMIPIICSLFMSQALSLNVPFWSFFVFIPAILVLSRMPISLDGFGVSEGLFIYFFSFVGLSGSEAFALGFVVHILAIVSILPGFFYYSFYSISPETKYYRSEKRKTADCE